MDVLDEMHDDFLAKLDHVREELLTTGTSVLIDVDGPEEAEGIASILEAEHTLSKPYYRTDIGWVGVCPVLILWNNAYDDWYEFISEDLLALNPDLW